MRENHQASGPSINSKAIGGYWLDKCQRPILGNRYHKSGLPVCLERLLLKCQREGEGLHKVCFSWPQLSFQGIATAKEKIALVKRDINNNNKGK